ncbi:unnamed protein product, partial [Urochloa humidicola]
APSSRVREQRGEAPFFCQHISTQPAAEKLQFELAELVPSG